jgi:hypothetical protein
LYKLRASHKKVQGVIIPFKLVEGVDEEEGIALSKKFEENLVNERVDSINYFGPFIDIEKGIQEDRRKHVKGTTLPSVLRRRKFFLQIVG